MCVHGKRTLVVLAGKCDTRWPKRMVKAACVFDPWMPMISAWQVGQTNPVKDNTGQLRYEESMNFPTFAAWQSRHFFGWLLNVKWMFLSTSRGSPQLFFCAALFCVMPQSCPKVWFVLRTFPLTMPLLPLYSNMWTAEADHCQTHPRCWPLAMKYRCMQNQGTSRATIATMAPSSGSI